MVFTSIEIIALIVIIASAIKILVLLVKPEAWMNFAKKLWSAPEMMKVVGLVLAGVILYYLLGSGMTIIQILAVTGFVASLLIIGLASEVDDIIRKYSARIKRGNLWKEFWFYTLLWVVLLVWGAYVLFA